MRRFRLALALILVAGCTRCARPVSGEIDLGPSLPKTARRIVSLAPSLTDLIVTLHAADRLVGVTRFDDAPEVASVARVGGYSDPDMEAVLRVRPDLIVCQPAPGNRGTVEALARTGIPVVALRQNTLEDVEAATQRLGQLLQLPDAAHEEVEQLRHARDEARQAAHRRGRTLRVAILVSLAPLIAGGPGSFLDEMLNDAGAEDIVARSSAPYPTVSPETFLRTKPDALLLALMPGEVPSKAPVAGLNVPTVSLHSEGFMRPGPKVIDALRELTADLDRLSVSGR